MLNRPFKSAFARAAIVALVLALAIPFVSGGLTSAQEVVEPPCKVVDKATGAVECKYAENGTDDVADFSALDPEGQAIDWDVEGTDAADFEIDGGVLTFKKSPNYEGPSDRAHDANDDQDTDDEGEAAGGNTYEVMVRATERLAEGQDPPALPSMLPVTVIVTDVDEPGSIGLNRVLPQAGAPLTATLSDPDRGEGNATIPTGLTWTWSVPKVSRPVMTNDAHWTAAGAEVAPVNDPTNLTSIYIPDPDSELDNDDGADNDKVLRVKVTYTDQAGATEKTAYMLSYRPVRPAPAANNLPMFDDTADFTVSVPENAGVGTAVGTPVTATDANDGDILSYELDDGADAGFFKIDIMTGQITVAVKLDHEMGGTDNDGVYDLTVTAYDPSNGMGSTATARGADDRGHVTITATDVNEVPRVALVAVGDATEMLTVPENHAVVDVEGDDQAEPVIEEVMSLILGTYIAEDDDEADMGEGNVPKLSLAGDDAAAFVLSDPLPVGDANVGAVQLRFKAKPNFEAPADANQDNAYKVSIVATDKKSLTGTRDLTIIVENIDEVGTVSLSTIQPAIGQEITAALTDPDGRISDMKWQWYSAGTDPGVFTEAIDGATSPSYTPQPPVPDDPETLGIDESDPGDEGRFLQARVTYRDGQSIDDVKTTETYEEGRRGVDNPGTGGDNQDDIETPINESVDAVGEALVYLTSQHAVRAAPDVNNAPVFAATTMTREVNERETGNVDDAVTADDPDGDSLNYTFTGGADMGSFTIVLGTGQIKVKTGTKLDFEGSQTSYEVEVTAADPFGKSDTTMVTIRVLNVNEAPDFMPADPEDVDFDENGTGSVATFAAADPEGAGIDWSVEGPDDEFFLIDANGVLTFKKSPDFENPLPVADTEAGIEAGNNEYEVTVRASEMRAADAEGETKSSTQDITVTVNNVEEPGSIDLDRVQPQTGVTLTASLNDDDGGVGDAEDIVVMWLWSVPKVSRPVLENNAHWTPAAGTNTAISYSPAGADETKVLRVRATYADGEGADKKAYMRSYNPVRPMPEGNDPPVFSDTGDYTRSIREDAPVGNVVGSPVRATDANAGDAGKLTYLLTADAVSDGKFKIDKRTGQITIASALNHEETPEVVDVGNAYTVTITVWDPSNNAESDPFTSGDAETVPVIITATDVNEAPTVAPATDTTEMTMVDENHIVANDDTVEPAVTGAIVLGYYTKSDPDDGDETRFSLSGDDASVFELSDPIAVNEDNAGAVKLSFKASPNYESPASATQANAYKVTIVATDKKGLTGTRELTIAVRNIDETGTIRLSTIQPGVGQEIVATLSDKDGGETGARWQWHSSDTEVGFLPIEDATSRSYTPKKTVKDDPLTVDVDESVTGDEGMFLRVTVDYRDAQSEDDIEDTPYEEGRRGIDDPRTGGTNQDDPNTPIDEEEDQIGEAPVMATSKNAVREVPDVNNPPVYASPSVMREVEENSGPGIAVGDPVTAADADGDTLTYTRTGGADMAAFTIDSTNGQLKVGEGTKLDFEGAQTTYVVEVTAKDPFGKSDSTSVTITVTNVNEKPDLTLIVDEPVTPPTPDAVVVTGDSAVDYEENGTEAVATYMSSVADVIWSLSGDDADDFEISGGELTFMSSPDWESPADADTDNVYMVTVAATDGTTTGTVSVTVTVTNMDEETTNGNGNGNGEFDPLSYDGADKGGNENGVIDRPEVITAIRDYFDDQITQDDVTAVIRAYFAS